MKSILAAHVPPDMQSDTRPKLKNEKKICTFKFRNGTKIRVAVPFLDGKANEYSYEQMLQMAKELSWIGEEHGRGGMRSFKIGETIFA